MLHVLNIPLITNSMAYRCIDRGMFVVYRRKEKIPVNFWDGADESRLLSYKTLVMDCRGEGYVRQVDRIVSVAQSTYRIVLQLMFWRSRRGPAWILRLMNQRWWPQCTVCHVEWLCPTESPLFRLLISLCPLTEKTITFNSYSHVNLPFCYVISTFYPFSKKLDFRQKKS